MNRTESFSDHDKCFPKVSIVTLNWNNPGDTVECLQTLREIIYPNFDIVVVDNGSTDDSIEIISKNFSDVMLIKNSINLGYTGGNNVGIEYALQHDAEHIFILNNDTVVDHNILKELVKVAESDPSVGMVACKIYKYGQDKIIDSVGCIIDFRETIANNRGHNQKDTGQFDMVEEVDSADGCGFLVKKEVVENIGMFDESYFAYCEEIDWNLRARKSGYKVLYCPDAVLWHKGSASTGGKYNAFRSYLVGRSALIFMKKHANFGEWLKFGFHLILRFPIAMVQHIRDGNLKAFLVKFKGGIWGLTRSK